MFNLGQPNMSAHGSPPSQIDTMGMTLRDYFAAAALTGILSNSANDNLIYNAEVAYNQADFMLKAREHNEQMGSS